MTARPLTKQEIASTRHNASLMGPGEWFQWSADMWLATLDAAERALTAERDKVARLRSGIEDEVVAMNAMYSESASRSRRRLNALLAATAPDAGEKEADRE